MYSVAVTLVCWPCAVFTSTFRYFLAICFRCIGHLFRSESPTDKSQRPKVACLVISLRSNVVAVTMDYYSQRRYSSRGSDNVHYRPFNQRRGMARPSMHWSQDETQPHYFSSEYERPLPYRSWSPGLGYRGSESYSPPNLRHFSSAARGPKNNFQYLYHKDTNTDRSWPYAVDGNMVYPDSAEEVRVSVYLT